MNEAGANAIQVYQQQFQERPPFHPVISLPENVTRDFAVDQQFLMSDQSPQEFAWAICPLSTWISTERNAFIRWDAFYWWNSGIWHGPHEFFLFLQGCLKNVSILEFLTWIGPELEQRDLGAQEQELIAYRQQMIIDVKKNKTHAKIYLEEMEKH